MNSLAIFVYTPGDIIGAALVLIGILMYGIYQIIDYIKKDH